VRERERESERESREGGRERGGSVCTIDDDQLAVGQIASEDL